MNSPLVILHFHLQYRLWISELNALIDQIRVLNDYLRELREFTGHSIDAQELLERDFVVFRNHIDELRNEMHLDKMQLAALLNTKTQTPTWDTQRTKELHAQYEAVKKDFHTLKTGVEKLRPA